MSRTAERHRAEIDAIIADIANLQRSMGEDKFHQAEDREAFEIVRRITRKLEREAGNTGEDVNERLIAQGQSN